MLFLFCIGTFERDSEVLNFKKSAMKKIFFIVLLVAGMSNISFSQIAFRTGNAEMETNLNSMNVNAKLDLGKFKADLSLSYGVTAPKVESLFSMSIEPAEVFLILEMGQIINKPVDEVVTVYKANKGKGWGVIAKEMGIKPGSAEFHALKNSSKGKSKKAKKDTKGPKGEKGSKGGKGKK